MNVVKCEPTPTSHGMKMKLMGNVHRECGVERIVTLCKDLVVVRTDGDGNDNYFYISSIKYDDIMCCLIYSLHAIFIIYANRCKILKFIYKLSMSVAQAGGNVGIFSE